MVHIEDLIPDEPENRIIGAQFVALYNSLILLMELL